MKTITKKENILNFKTSKIYKNKRLNNANFGTYNLNDYQVFLYLITKIGGVDQFGCYIQSDDLQRKHTLTAKEFSKCFNIDLNTVYGVLKRASNKLARTAITLEKSEFNELWNIPICSYAQYNLTEGSLTVEFNEYIMPYLAQVKEKFVLYNLKEIANFGSLYSTRLYELIQEFKDTGYIIKTVQDLRNIFAVGLKFPDYNNFKRKTFVHAINEINSQYELNLRFEEVKNGRKVASVIFYFTPTIIKKIINPYNGNEVNQYIKPRYKNSIQNINVDAESLISENIKNIKPHINKVDNCFTQSKKVVKEIFKPLINEKVYAAIEDGTSIMKAMKDVRNNRAKELKEIISALMKKGMSEREAKLEAIELELIPIIKNS